MAKRKIPPHIPVSPQEILSIPMDPETNDCRARTIGEYLYSLLGAVLRERERFSGKRPFGNSDWDGQLMVALHKAGRINLTLDEYGYIEDLSEAEEIEGIKLLIDAATWLLEGATDGKV